MIGVNDSALSINDGDGASTFEARIDCHDPSTSNWWLQQQIFQVGCKHVDGVFFRFFSQLAPDLAFETGNNQPSERITNAFIEKRFEGVAFGNQLRDCHFEYLSLVVLDFDPQFVGSLAAVNRQNSMMG